MALKLKSLTIGSSPLTRGTPVKTAGMSVQSRFIPAYAGNSPFSQRSHAGLSVHPRLRGELGDVGIDDVIVPGSSPLTQGTLKLGVPFFFCFRFIPAYAGNSWAEGSRTDASFGSSPLTRGTHIHINLFALNERFIPAYAGNSA